MAAFPSREAGAFDPPAAAAQPEVGEALPLARPVSGPDPQAAYTGWSQAQAAAQQAWQGAAAQGQPAMPTEAAAPDATQAVPQIGQAATAAESDDDFEEDEAGLFRLEALGGAPPWLISIVVHATLLLILALIVLQPQLRKTFEFEAVFASDIGEQLDDRLSIETDTSLDVIDPIVTPLNLPQVEDPLAAPPAMPLEDYLGSTAMSEMEVPTVGLALTGRQPGMKRALLAAYGGNRLTEAAVERALEWLKRNQRQNGSWSLSGPYNDGALNDNVLSATAMALLAFQGAGHTPEEGAHKAVVAKGWRYLLAQQDDDGDFWREAQSHQRLYAQAQATIAICELYGMTQNEEYREPAQRALDYALAIQTREGGWRYQPGSGSDTSVTGWFVMALQSALMAGLDVPGAALENVNRYLDSASAEGGSHYCYLPGGAASVPMTAEGLLCRQYLGWKKSDARLVGGVEFLLANPINYRERDVYYWYYATQVTHHMGGEAWHDWNAVMREALPAEQVQEGRENGSWNPKGDRWDSHGGRLYTTCLSVYMLEVYYRHLPIYSSVYEE